MAPGGREGEKQAQGRGGRMERGQDGDGSGWEPPHLQADQAFTPSRCGNFLIDLDFVFVNFF